MHFKTLTWVPVEGLTTEEKKIHDDNERKRIEMKTKEAEKCEATISVGNAGNGSQFEMNEPTSSLPTTNKDGTRENIIASTTLKDDADINVRPSDQNDDPSHKKDSLNAEDQNLIKTELVNTKDKDNTVLRQTSSGETNERPPKRLKRDEKQCLLQGDVLQDVPKIEGEPGTSSVSHLYTDTEGGVTSKEPQGHNLVPDINLKNDDHELET